MFLLQAINAAGHRSSLNHAPNQTPLQVNQGIQGYGFVPAEQTLTSPNSSTSNAYKKLDGRQRYHDNDSIIEITRVPDPFGNDAVNARVLPQMDPSTASSQQFPRYITGRI
ncbi:hypothetical protein AAVH_43811 [Aphelenchoides avenae]|nr:hypothetical protein AAVH_43811 [Aphelenchus avenae]